ncbi:MAG: glycoside hydrolase family 78 protein [Oscillospiraceae bacterium]|jgi:alpha-L-rhamnosidase|nr:glycoside hydrolase family 78 protein [Oscillospiraceae bacterium]
MVKFTSFIAAGTAYTTRERGVPAPYLRRVFQLKKLPKTAALSVCVSGFYELFINGQNITRGRLSPFVSNPDDLLYWDEYQIKPYLRDGENVVGLLLGNGFANNPGGRVWDFDKAKFRAAPCASVRLELDGTAAEAEEESFLTAPSPIIYDDYRAGETYDARLEIPGWAEPGFDADGWKPAVPVSPPRGCTVENAVPPVLVTEERAPISVKPLKDGYLYDFGVNLAGVCRLRVSGMPGQKLTLHYGERLLSDGSLNLRNLCCDAEDEGYIQKDIYICKGGEEEWTPTFTYHGFQYVWVRGLTEAQATPDALTYLVMNTALSERGGFICSDETANLLQTLTRRSTLANFHHIPTDCPQREKNGWTADAALSAEHTLLNLSPEANYRQWLQGIRKAQAEDGQLPGIVPTAGWGFQWGNGPAWDCVLVLLPYFTYLYRGGLEILKENAHAILRYLEYLTTRVGEDGLLAIGLGDWCPPGMGCDQYKAPLCLTDTMIAMDVCEKSAYIFDQLNHPFHKAFAEGLYTQLKTAARARLADLNTMTALGNCQTSQAMAIFYNLFEPAEKPEACRRLLEIIERDGGFMDTGVLGARVIFHVLARFGHAALAFDMITRPEFPSYGWWIEQGATSLWEDFQEYEHNASMNHHFWGDISHWFIRWLAGIHYNPRGRGGELDIRPQFIPQLTHARGFYAAPEGKIAVGWAREDNGIRLEIEMPQTLSGRIILPAGVVFENKFSTGLARTGVFSLKHT